MENSEINLDIEKISSLCKRRGFIFQSSEIYGGLASTWDYGPLGVELKRNVKDNWWNQMVWERDDIIGLDSSILMHPDTWRASGHLDSFTDPLIECKDCNKRFREDHLDSDIILKKSCPEPDCSGELGEARMFHLMFKTFMGPVEDDAAIVYLRPETAQGIFVNFNNVVTSSRKKLPFGIAQIGKAFRNEITPRNFIFRVREFEQLELEFFVLPGQDEKWHKYWIDQRYNWWINQGIDKNNLHLENVESSELSHYSKATVDILYNFPHGKEELEGIANRTDFDLGSHTKNQKDFKISSKIIKNDKSTTKLAMQKLEDNSWYIPFVIEPSAGVERGVLALLNEAYKVDEKNSRTILALKPNLSPIKAALIPLKRNNEQIVNCAKKIKNKLQKLGLGRVVLENSGNIGKNYRRHDEIGTPICITVDFETLENNTVTVRDRDTMDQKRINESELNNFYKKYFE